MKKSFLMILSFVSIILISVTGCEDDPPQGIYNPNYQSAGTPAVTTIVPENAPYFIAGVTTAVVTGSNFSTDTSKIIVYCDATVATVTSATATEIKFRVPNFSKDTVKVKIAVQGATNFSSEKIISIKPSVETFTVIDTKNEKAWGITIDKNNALYVSVTTAGGVGLGVKKIVGDTLRSDFSNRTTDNEWAGIKVGPGDTLYAVRNLAVLFALRQSTNPIVYINGISNGSLSALKDLDFDSQKNIWAGGEGTTKLYRINTNKQIRSFPFTGDVRSVRVYNNALYVGGRTIVGSDTTEGVFKFPIIAADTSLGTMETYFNLKTNARYAASKAYAITFDNSGTLYLGTDHADGIIKVETNGTSGPFYYGVIGAKIISFAWSTGNALYAVRERASTATQELIKIDMQKTGAPYFGRE